MQLVLFGASPPAVQPSSEAALPRPSFAAAVGVPHPLPCGAVMNIWSREDRLLLSRQAMLSGFRVMAVDEGRKEAAVGEQAKG